MKMPWYDIVEPYAPITQGDIIMNCPVVAWKEGAPTTTDSSLEEMLRASVEYIEIDTVTMTQACDLEQKKVQYVILCPHYSLSDYEQQWKNDMIRSGQNPTTKAWKSHIEDIRQGAMWHFSMLNESTEANLRMDIRIADFREVFNLPRDFLEDWLKQQGKRLRLLPPYREHLSQAFARFFMRVGLPNDISKFR